MLINEIFNMPRNNAIMTRKKNHNTTYIFRRTHRSCYIFLFLYVLKNTYLVQLYLNATIYSVDQRQIDM